MFYDRFELLCKNRGVSCKAAAIEMGLSNSISAKWKKTGATPNGKTLNIIADYFGVSVAYLLTGEEDKNKPVFETGDELSALDLEILRRLSDLTPDERSKVDAFVQGLLANREA